MSDADSLLTLRDVEVHFEHTELLGFGASELVRAVDGVDITIEENEVIALVGESGCGKTTLGKTAVGLQRPTNGQVLYRGQDIWRTKHESGPLKNVFYGTDTREYSYQEMQRALQIIHQDPESSLNSNYTVMSLLMDPLKRWQPELSEPDRRARILAFLEYVGMTPPEDYANRYPHQLSGGEQQRVVLVRALLMNPDVILADEAISALDVSLRIEMMDLMLELQDKFDTSFLFVSHDLSNARYLTTKSNGKIGIMYLGRLVEYGPAEEILEDPQHPYTKVLLWATPDLETGNVGDPPVRSIDIPDPANKPSGCPFHNRCQEAREACREEEPPLYNVSQIHQASCFRMDTTHEYWRSPELIDENPETESVRQES